MKYLAVFALVGVAVAYPAADGPPPAPYKPAPAPYKPAPYNAPPPAYKPAPSYGPPKGYKEPEYAPQPYQFEYGVSDQYTGTNFQAVENQNEKGSVIGSYRVNLPDGRVQTVTYTADDYGGFVADVKYEGEAVYPPEPAEGYGNSHGPKYHAAPAPKYQPAPKYRPAPAPKYAPA